MFNTTSVKFASINTLAIIFISFTVLSCGRTEDSPAENARANNDSKKNYAQDGYQSFNSELEFDVYTVSVVRWRDSSERIGSTPSEEPILIPPDTRWVVSPKGDWGIKSVIEEVRKNSIHGLGLSGEITDEDLKHLKEANNLRMLSIHGAEGVTDEGLSVLSELGALHTLQLTWLPNITDKSMKSVSELIQLQYLALEGTDNITDESLAYISALQNLISLDLGWNRNVTGLGLGKLI